MRVLRRRVLRPAFVSRVSRPCRRRSARAVDVAGTSRRRAGVDAAPTGRPRAVDVKRDVPAALFYVAVVLALVAFWIGAALLIAQWIDG